MREKNLTDADVARELNCRQSTVFQWKAGGFSPKANSVIKMCKLFDCSPNELLGWGLKQSTNINYAKREDLYQAVIKKGAYNSDYIHRIASKINRMAGGKITEFELWFRDIAEVVYRIELTQKKKTDNSGPTVEQLRLI